MTDTMRRAIEATKEAEACDKCNQGGDRAIDELANHNCMACAERAIAAAFRVVLAEPPGHDDISRAGLDAMRAVSDGESVGGPGWFVASMVLLALREALGLETP